MKLRDALDDFSLANRANGLKPATIRWYDSLLKSLLDAFPDTDLESLATKMLRQYIVDLQNRGERYISAPQRPTQAGGLSEASIAGHIRALHAFFAWAADEYQLDNPMKRIKRQKYTPKPKAVTNSDFVQLFNATGDNRTGRRDRAMLAMFADSGLRLGGLLSQEVSKTFTNKRYAIVTEKGNTVRRVVFTHYTARLLEAWLDVRISQSPYLFTSMNTGEQLTMSGVHQILKRLKAKAGVAGRVNPHGFRHNFAIQYLMNGGDLATLSKLLGHTDVNTTAMYYAVFSRDELAIMHEKFTPLRGMKLQN
ncbi:MAG: tyrosine-type recombinase/integrase [Anaerolineae bacterium]|nr:tyrosine-type recombinase/integrase [Anaerolineae bacterium]